MIRFFDILSFLLEWGYVFVFFWIIITFLPLRKNWLLRILALFANSILSTMIIYSNDLVNLLGTLLGFFAYLIVFHRGRWIEKITAVLVFYPALIAINYLMLNTGMKLFFFITNAPKGASLGWTKSQLIISTAIHTFSLLLRLLFWIAAWWFLRKYLYQITFHLTDKMWLIVDTLMLSPFVAIFTIIYFMPQNPFIVYPICGTSIFSSFGCIYLASYICNSVRTAYHAQELEMKQAYYTDRINDEERVRRIYHDLKNHLLVLQAQTENKQNLQTPIRALQNQIQKYENYYHTGNEFLDIIIRDKAKTAQEKQIDFNAVISLKDSAFIEPFDISTIFGNALDNAIEASEKLPPAQRLITIKANHIRDMLIITVTNNTASDCYIPEKTTKKDTFSHGFGLTNIKKAVEQYEGQCYIKIENGIFTLKIIIPIP